MSSVCRHRRRGATGGRDPRPGPAAARDQPELEITEIDTSAFRANPAKSNRITITIADRTIEEWLGGHTGGSRCCSVCGDSNCRTVEVGGVSFEMIPERLIVKAALLASAALLEEVPEEALGCCS
jgi:hypothetical protein